MKKLPIGIADFRDMVTGNYYYVDKTLFIKEIIDSGDKILLIPRPRRFGKTLNLSMLGYFYNCCPVSWAPDFDSEAPVPAVSSITPGSQTFPAQTSQISNKHLFDALAIGNAGQEYLDKMNKFPVIFLSFKDTKEKTWEICLKKIKQLIQDQYLAHDYLLNSPSIKPAEKTYFNKIIDLTGDIADYEHSLEKLLVFITRFYNNRAVILIDEYDAPVHTGYHYGYYEEIVNFIRNFLGGGLKDTGQYLEKGVVTGIMRIAKESIFSGFNNPGVYTMLSSKFSSSFGLTEEEVKTMLAYYQIPGMYDQVKTWYDGYRFGGKVIYNPWSIINFLNNEEKELIPYWINTSENQLVETLLTSSGTELKEELEQLIRGESIEKSIDENIVLKNLTHREDLLWSFLLMGGYLKQISKRRHPTSGKFIYTLSIPNEEVKTTYVSIIENYFAEKVSKKNLEIMLKALIEGEIKHFEKMLKMVVLAVFSYHDFGNEPEKVYHALVAGLLIWITDTHEIKSNRESGFGRYDIIIIPRDPLKIGYVIEFKSVESDENETVDSAVNSALAQIDAQKYETELIERGIKQIKKLAIVFSGKEVFVKEQVAVK